MKIFKILYYLLIFISLTLSIIILPIQRKAIEKSFSNTLHCGKYICKYPFQDLDEPIQTNNTYNKSCSILC